MAAFDLITLAMTNQRQANHRSQPHPLRERSSLIIRSEIGQFHGGS